MSPVTSTENHPPIPPEQLKRWRRLLASDRDAASRYRRIAYGETGERRELLLELAESELRHAGRWEGMLRAAGSPIGKFSRIRMREAGEYHRLVGARMRPTTGRWSMVSDARAKNGLSATGGQIGPRLARSLRRAWGTEKGRRRLGFLVGLVVVVVIIGLGTLMFSSISGQSQSYRDGYSAGGSAFGTYGSEGAQQACKTMELRSPGLGGLAPRDNSAEWLKGCLAGFNATQADE